MPTGHLNNGQHVIDLAGSSDASTSTSSHDRYFNGVDTTEREDGPNGARLPVSQQSISPSNVSRGSNYRNAPSIRQEESRRPRNPLNSGFWISIELFLTISQLTASIIVLSLSKHERPRTPLNIWIIGYAYGCFLILPLLYWRYFHGNQIQVQDPYQPHQTSPQINVSSGTYLSVNGARGGEDDQATVASSRSNQGSRLVNPRTRRVMDYYKLALDIFFAVWFIVGIVWIFGGPSSAKEAPNLYRLTIVFLTFCCIGYAMPFILCATICCCLPCIISIFGVREDQIQTRGATVESINALPTHKFKMKKSENNGSNSSVGEGGIVAAGTEKERVISEEDATCCICLINYEDDDELRELTCSHLFHKDCVDKWLKINATCPLCKGEVGETAREASGSGVNAGQRVRAANENAPADTLL